MANPTDKPDQIELPPARRPDGHRAFTLQEEIDLNRIREILEPVEAEICDIGHRDDAGNAD